MRNTISKIQIIKFELVKVQVAITFKNISLFELFEIKLQNGCFFQVHNFKQ